MHRGKDLHSRIDSSQCIHRTLSCVMQIQKLTSGSNTGLCDAAPNLIHPYKAYLLGYVSKAPQPQKSRERQGVCVGGCCRSGEARIIPCQAAPRAATGEPQPPMSRCETHHAEATLPQLLTEGGDCLGDMGHVMGCRGKAGSDTSESLSSANLIPT